MLEETGKQIPIISVNYVMNNFTSWKMYFEKSFNNVIGSHNLRAGNDLKINDSKQLHV